LNDELHRMAFAALELYALPAPLNIELINISENATFRVTAPSGRKWALRLHRLGYHSDAAIKSELAWLMALRADGVAVTPRPVVGLNGEILQTQTPRNAVLFDWEDGAEPMIGDNLENSFVQLGAVAAQMHVHSKHWDKPSYFQRFTWNFETSLGEAAPHWGHWRKGMGVGSQHIPLFQKTVDVIGQRLAVYGKHAERFGLVHGDLRLANLLVDQDTVKVIDFDDCGFSWFMYDAATPFSFYEHDPKLPALLEAWKAGYRSVSELSAADEHEIPTFIMLRRLLLVAWIGTRSETQLAQSMGVAYTEGSLELCERYLSEKLDR
jgi:Ser/Thr protein kinase RdoA (MazF antagonist)